MGFYTIQAVNLTRWNGDERDIEWKKLIREIEHRNATPWVRQEIETLSKELKTEHQRRRAMESDVQAMEKRHQESVALIASLRNDLSRLNNEVRMRKLNHEWIVSKLKLKELRGMRSTGKVRWYNQSKGKGAIIDDGGGYDFTVYYADIIRTGLDLLYEGQKVRFSVKEPYSDLVADDLELL